MVKCLLYAMRHGETRWNAAGRFQGRSDHALSVAGRRQARENAEHLRSHFDSLDIRSDGLAAFSSPLRRTRETMKLVLEQVGFPKTRFNADSRLMEASFGRWEGMTTFEVKERYPAERRQRKADRWNFKSHGGDSYADLSHSMQEFLGELDFETPVLIVTHAGNIRVMLGLLEGWERQQMMMFPIPHDAVMCWDGERLAWI